MPLSCANAAGQAATDNSREKRIRREVIDHSITQARHEISRREHAHKSRSFRGGAHLRARTRNPEPSPNVWIPGPRERRVARNDRVKLNRKLRVRARAPGLYRLHVKTA